MQGRSGGRKREQREGYGQKDQVKRVKSKNFRPAVDDHHRE